MRKLLLGGLLALATFGTAYAQGSHHVSGYTRSDGTYVAPHYQTNPNSTTSDNYSTRGNINPYTGAVGTRPDTRPTYGYVPAPTYTAPTYAPPSYRPPSYTPPPTYGYTPPKPTCYYGTSC